MRSSVGKVLLMAFALAGLLVGTASAGSIFHLGPGVTDPCAYGCAGDPNNIGSSGLDVSVVSGGSLKSPLTSVLLLLAVPDDSTGSSISAGSFSVASYSGTGSPGGFTLLAGSGTVTLNTFTSGFNSGDVYSFMGLSGGNNSNSFVNFNATELARLGLTPSSYGVYEFLITGITLDDKGAIQVDLSSDLPNGTIAAAYQQVCTTNPAGKTQCDVYDNAYTEAGFVDGPPQVPEPASLMLLGSGLSAVAFRLRRRK